MRVVKKMWQVVKSCAGQNKGKDDYLHTMPTCYLTKENKVTHVIQLRILDVRKNILYV